MRRRHLLWLVVLLALTACATSPTGRWAQTRSALTAAQDSVLAAHRAGIVDDGALDRANPHVLAARQALYAAEAYLPDGGPEFNYQLQIAEDGIIQILAVIEDRE